MTTLVKSSEINENSTEFQMRCAFPNCNSRIIPSSKLPQMLTTVNHPPTMLRLSKSSGGASNTTESKKFYKIADVWDFDNIGVSRKIPEDNGDIDIDGNTVSVQRLLVCSDCDRGPIGFAGFIKGGDETKVENLIYFIHNDSVLYELQN